MSSSWPSCEYMLDKQHRPVPGRQIGSPCSRIRPPAGGRPLRCLQGQSKHAKRGSVVSRGGTGGGRPGPTRRRIRRDDADVGRTRNGRFSGGAREVKGFGISSSPRQVVYGIWVAFPGISPTTDQEEPFFGRGPSDRSEVGRSGFDTWSCHPCHPCPQSETWQSRQKHDMLIKIPYINDLESMLCGTLTGMFV